jgi:hypothetical protein
MLMSAITAFPSRRGPRAITPALCWAHAGRQFFELADIAANPRRGKNAAAISPVAEEAVKRIDALFDIERDNGCMTTNQAVALGLGRQAGLLNAPAFGPLRRFRAADLPHQQAAVRALRGFCAGAQVSALRWLRARCRAFRGMATLIAIAKLNDIDPQAWLAEVDRIANIPQTRLYELLS